MHGPKFISIQSLRPSLKPNIKRKPLQPFKHLNISTIISSKYLAPREIDRHNSFDYYVEQKLNKTAINQTLLTDIYFHRDYNDLASSYSFQEQQSYELQKQIFCKFLQSNFENWLEFTNQIHQLDLQDKHIVEIVKIGRNQSEVSQNRKISHFIGVWMISMKYKDIQTKARIIQSVKLVFSNMQSGAQQIAQIMYDSLMRGFLPEDLQLKLLLQTCRRGWEYFSFSICRIIKVLKKIQHFSNAKLYEEMFKAINN